MTVGGRVCGPARSPFGRHPHPCSQARRSSPGSASSIHRSTRGGRGPNEEDRHHEHQGHPSAPSRPGLAAGRGRGGRERERRDSIERSGARAGGGSVKAIAVCCSAQMFDADRHCDLLKKLDSRGKTPRLTTLDIGATVFVWSALRQAARRGCGVLLISSDLDELFDVSHRMVVMLSGCIVAEFVPPHDIASVGRAMIGASA